MKRLTAYIPTAFLLLAVLTGCKSELDCKFEELDRAISMQSVYDNAANHVADSLRAQFYASETDSLRWLHAQELFAHYQYYQADSSLRYIGKMKEYSEDRPERIFAAAMSEAMVYTSLRDYSYVQTILGDIDKDSLDEAQLARYYFVDLYLDGTKVVDEGLPRSVRDAIVATRHQKRLAYINCPGIDPFEKVRRQAMQYYESERPEEAIALLEDLISQPLTSFEKCNATYTLAYAYKYMGDREKREYWLAQSAIYAIQSTEKESMALYELSNMLFEDDELGRASRYCQVSLENALFCNYTARVMNSSGTQLSIIDAVEHEAHRNRVSMTVACLMLSMLLLATVFLLIYVMRQRNRIHRINRRLEEANRIKEGYVFRYINLSAEYLKMLEGQRHDLRVALKEGGADAVKAKLRDPAANVTDYKSFYKVFDETFLGLFPDFIDKVNELLVPEARFDLKGSTELTTPLRILAAIKLGFTDSGKIAEFLNSAPSSVYTYRSKLKKASVCNNEEFEDRIRNI